MDSLQMEERKDKKDIHLFRKYYVLNFLEK